ncbi:MAG: CBS domain-containing protein [Gammaproteobacteria bacterium]|jgi:CBS domain-containing protein|nr:CBS domain-containing protein [Gammaproteobacteria bacterium]
MIEGYAVLNHIPLKPGTPCLTPGGLRPLVHIDDPATRVMTDFRQVTPVTIEPRSKISTALDKMKEAGVRLLFVPDRDDHIIGIIIATDIQGERPIRLAEESGILHGDISVAMIMTPLEEIGAVDMRSVSAACVGHIVNTLRSLERQHTLVVEVDQETEQHTIRGLFSTTHISKLLGQDITDPEYAVHSFAEVHRELG